ncbi:hypothetical protein OG474_18220 [Kribbella sp. NBC_01505]|uniref:hypothetical protein n=1 Tax=Kribbella sp. NBC_01505 TaxID=2903580 RepID=UPI003862E021
MDEHDTGEMPTPKLTEDEYRRTVESLSGVRLMEVTYYPFAGGDDGNKIDDWDFGAWHEPTMGVGLRTEDGTRYSAVWDSSFGDYGLELLREPMSSQLLRIGEPGSPAEVAVTDHPAWSAFIGVPLVGAEILWSDSGQGLRVPTAVELRAPDSTAWLIAGRSAQWPPDGRFFLGTDDVMTVFSHEFASTIGLFTATEQA